MARWWSELDRVYKYEVKDVGDFPRMLGSLQSGILYLKFVITTLVVFTFLNIYFMAYLAFYLFNKKKPQLEGVIQILL